jgi:hypothetical protein
MLVGYLLAADKFIGIFSATKMKNSYLLSFFLIVFVSHLRANEIYLSCKEVSNNQNSSLITKPIGMTINTENKTIVFGVVDHQINSISDGRIFGYEANKLDSSVNYDAEIIVNRITGKVTRNIKSFMLVVDYQCRKFNVKNSKF